MPPRRRVSAPESRVYKSATPKRQQRLPSPKRRIRSYGKQSGGPKLKKDNTLTQMDFVTLLEHQDAPIDQEEKYEEEEEEEKDSSYEEQARKRKTKRRRTTGDESDVTPQLKQQTLTQIIDVDRNWNEVPQEEDTIFDGPSSSQSVQLPTKAQKRVRAVAVAREITREKLSPVREMPPPQTPRRISTREIPSSQSPATPVSVHTRNLARPSPLREKSMNMPIPFNQSRRTIGSPLKKPKLEVKDTFSTESSVSQINHIPSSPPKRSSPAKSVRFAIPEEYTEEEIEHIRIASPSLKREDNFSPISQHAPRGISKYEICDSEAESDEEYLIENKSEPPFTLQSDLEQPEQEDESQIVENCHEEGKPSPEPELVNQADILMLDENKGDNESRVLGEDNSEEDEQAPETCYGVIGIETQFEVERLANSSLSKSTTLTQVEEQREADSHTSGDTHIVEETSYEKSQILESQRLETQYVATMAPRTTDSDVFISIPPQHVKNILSRVKNHEMRNWSLPHTVCRLWIYETSPISTLKYMAEIGPAKRPGEILDERGIGNLEFNAKKGSWRAYEILQLYELADPLPLSKLIVKEWLKEPPKRWSKVRPAALDELMANLMHPLFDPESLAAPTSLSSDSQEAEAQLISTIRQFTQLHPPPHLSSPYIKSKPCSQEELIPSSQHEEDFHRNSILQPPSQAETVDLTQTQTPRRPSTSEVIRESPTRPVHPSSTPSRLPTPHSEWRGWNGHQQDSLVPFSMASSQLLTRSQMLSDSLLDQSVPDPPHFVGDSEDDDEDEL